MKLRKILTTIVVAMLFITSCTKNELNNSKPTVKSTTTVQNPVLSDDKGGPPPPPANTSSPIFAQDLGPLNPAVLGSYSWSDFYNPMPPYNTLPYLIQDHVVTGLPFVTVGFNYLGPVELDNLGNEIDPFEGANIEVKRVPCGLNGSNEELFDLLPNDTRVTNLDGSFQASHGKMLVLNPLTNTMEMGWVLNFVFNKSETPTCYIIKVTLNGQTFYRRISVP